MAKVQKISASHTVKILNMAETASGSNVQSKQSACYRNLTWKNKAWNESNKCM